MSAVDINTVIEQLSHTTVDADAVLSFAGRGLKLDTDGDAQEIVDAVVSCKDLTALELKGNTLGIEAAKAIGKALEKQSEFKRALWSDLFTGRLKTEIPDALKHLCGGLMTANAHLVELDLSDNAFGPNGMVGLTGFLRSASCFSLRELRLNNNGLGIQGGKMLAESLLACHTSSVTAGHPIALRVFVSGRGRLEDEGAAALALAFKAMKSLEEVHMPQNGINHKGITALADAFSVNTSLRHINLSDNTFTAKGSESMAKALPHLSNLEVINFDDCLIRTDGAKALAKALANNNQQLQTLKLSGNEISKQGAEAVVKAVCNKVHIEELDLNCNQLGAAGIESIRNLLKSADKLDMLRSLSDDEGTEDEDDNDDDEDDDDDDDEDVNDHKCDNEAEGNDKNENETEPDNEEDSESVVVHELEIRGEAITIHPSPVMVPVDHFLNSPTLETFQQLGENKYKILTDYLMDKFADAEKVLPVFMKVLQVSDEQSKAVLCECADAILSRAYQQAEATSTCSVLSNALLVHLGLIKSEDKNFHAPKLTNDSLSVLQHVVQQSYFPQSAKHTLAFFIAQSKSKSESCSLGWQQVLETLHTLKAEH
jgi:Ran GTPase-activating protein 1